MDQCGRVIDEPTQPGPNPPGNGGGERRKYGISTYESNAKANYAWRLGGGMASLGPGLLTTGPISDGIAGPVGVVCCASGLALLAGLIPSKQRPW